MKENEHFYGFSDLRGLAGRRQRGVRCVGMACAGPGTSPSPTVRRLVDSIDAHTEGDDVSADVAVPRQQIDDVEVGRLIWRCWGKKTA